MTAAVLVLVLGALCACAPAGDDAAPPARRDAGRADATARPEDGPAGDPAALVYDATNPLTRPPAPALPPLPLEAETLRVGPPLVIASDLAHYPFVHLDAHGEPAGRDVEMMDAIGRLLGRPNEWRRMPFGAVLDAVAAGEASVGCATIGHTPERAERVLFTRPYFRTTLSVLVREGDDEPRELSALAGRRVHAAAGTTSERAARERLPDAVLVTDGGADPLRLLLSGEVDALVEDGPDAERHAREHQGLRVLPRTLGEETYHLVVPPDRPGFARRLDELLDHLEASGELALYSKRHGIVPW